MLHLYKNPSPPKDAYSKAFYEMIEKIETNLNFFRDIHARNFNHYLFECAKNKAKVTPNVVAIGPSQYQDYFDLHGGRMYTVKFTYQDISDRKKPLIKIDHRNTMFVSSQGELFIYDTDKIHIIAGLIDKHRESKPGLKSELMGAIEPKKNHEVDRDAFLNFPCYHLGKKETFQKRFK